MSRKDAINSLFLKKPEPAATPQPKSAERVRTGAIAAMGSSLQEMTDGARAAERLQQQLADLLLGQRFALHEFFELLDILVTVKGDALPAPAVAARPDDWETLTAGLIGCARCPLAGPATQAVPGEGPRDPALTPAGEFARLSASLPRFLAGALAAESLAQPLSALPG